MFLTGSLVQGHRYGLFLRPQCEQWAGLSGCFLWILVVAKSLRKGYSSASLGCHSLSHSGMFSCPLPKAKVHGQSHLVFSGAENGWAGPSGYFWDTKRVQSCPTVFKGSQQVYSLRIIHPSTSQCHGAWAEPPGWVGRAAGDSCLVISQQVKTILS